MECYLLCCAVSRPLWKTCFGRSVEYCVTGSYLSSRFPTVSLATVKARGRSLVVFIWCLTAQRWILRMCLQSVERWQLSTIKTSPGTFSTFGLLTVQSHSRLTRQFYDFTTLQGCGFMLQLGAVTAYYDSHH